MTNLDPSQIDPTLERIRAALEGGRVEEAMQELARLRPADRAEAFSDLTDSDQASLLPRFPIPAAADLLTELEEEDAADAAETFSSDRLADVLDEMPPDDAADIIGDLSPDRAAEVLASMEDAEEVFPLLGHPDESAGGLMTTDYIALRRHTTAAQAIDFLRQTGPASTTPYYLYVVDRDRKLIGVVGLRDLVASPPDATVETIMKRDVIRATTSTDQEDVARLMTRYNVGAVPVVDDQGVLKGVVTYEDVLDVLVKEATEDLYRLANVSDADLTVHSPVHISVGRRLPWLLVNLLTALFASWVISRFESTIARVAILAAFQSVVAGMGGNAATQTLAIMVRSIALGHVRLRDASGPLLREMATGLINGIVVGVAAGLGLYLWKGNPWLGLILGLATLGNLVVAGLVGAFVPLALKSVRLDPALASSVIVTTFTDCIGFALFLGLATAFLPRLS